MQSDTDRQFVFRYASSPVRIDKAFEEVTPRIDSETHAKLYAFPAFGKNDNFHTACIKTVFDGKTRTGRFVVYERKIDKRRNLHFEIEFTQHSVFFKTSGKHSDGEVDIDRERTGCFAS